MEVGTNCVCGVLCVCVCVANHPAPATSRERC